MFDMHKALVVLLSLAVTSTIYPTANAELTEEEKYQCFFLIENLVRQYPERQEQCAAIRSSGEDSDIYQCLVGYGWSEYFMCDTN